MVKTFQEGGATIREGALIRKNTALKVLKSPD